VPVALVGAELPPAEEGGAPFAIKLSKLRGVESQGMLCSARELKLSDDHSGLLILPEDTPIGQDIRETLNLDDTVFEIKLTPNKADCLSVFGVARETSAITGAPLHALDIKPATVTLNETLPVKISAPDLCGRFSGRVIRGVNARAKSPQWMVERLARSGQRSISALVDISNYVMLELGRPSHVFDLDKIHGSMDVRWGRKGETLKLLNGNTVELDETVGVIADDQHIESLAGIMGGDSTAVTLDTTNIYLEAAFWWPDSIRAYRTHHATDPRHLRWRSRPGRRSDRQRAAARAGEDACRACEPHHRRCDRCRRDRSDLHAPRSHVHAGWRRVLRDTAVVSLRPRNRRRPD